MIFVPPRFAADSILEAAAAGVELVIAITEGIPAHDELRVYNTLQRDHPGHAPGRPQLPRHPLPRQGQRRHHPGVLLQAGQRRRGLALGHADLPDRQRDRPGRLRLQLDRRHRRRPGARLLVRRHPRALRGRRADRAGRALRRDRRLGRGGGRRVHRRAHEQARGRLHRRLHRAGGQADGPRRRDRLRLGRHRRGEGARRSKRRACASGAPRPKPPRSPSRSSAAPPRRPPERRRAHAAPARYAGAPPAARYAWPRWTPGGSDARRARAQARRARAHARARSATRRALRRRPAAGRAAVRAAARPGAPRPRAGAPRRGATSRRRAAGSRRVRPSRGGTARRGRREHARRPGEPARRPRAPAAAERRRQPPPAPARRRPAAPPAPHAASAGRPPGAAELLRFRERLESDGARADPRVRRAARTPKLRRYASDHPDPPSPSPAARPRSTSSTSRACATPPCARSRATPRARPPTAPSVGYPRLRSWIADHHGVEPERVLVTNGSLQADAFLFDQLVRAGDEVIVERPTYDRTLLVAAHSAARQLHAVELEPDGIDTEALAHAARGRRAAEARAHHPQLPEPRRLHALARASAEALLALAARARLPVFEDDPYVELRFSGEPLPTMLSMDPERVVYASSFTKTVCPGIRVGYLVGPPDLIARDRRAGDQHLHLAEHGLASRSSTSSAPRARSSARSRRSSAALAERARTLARGAAPRAARGRVRRARRAATSCG